jgi:isopentenyl diphosphate isomerase/L-lactate dehydrogenase-like FMN-dependent dehydrogenase
LLQWKRISNGRPLVIKGIQSAADAQRALRAGCEGIVVSNHAGRQVDGAVGSLEVLPEIVDAVGDSQFFIISAPPCFQILILYRDDNPV